MSAMRQAAPWPQALEYLTGRLHYRPGRTFRLAGIDRGQGSKGLTLIITTRGYRDVRQCAGLQAGGEGGRT